MPPRLLLILVCVSILCIGAFAIPATAVDCPSAKCTVSVNILTVTAHVDVAAGDRPVVQSVCGLLKGTVDRIKAIRTRKTGRRTLTATKAVLKLPIHVLRRRG